MNIVMHMEHPITTRMAIPVATAQNIAIAIRLKASLS